MGKKVSSLLPIEYCQLDRATRLLKCEFADIIHWFSIGAIELCVKDPGEGIIRVFREDGNGVDYKATKKLITDVYINEGVSFTKYTSAEKSRYNNESIDEINDMPAEDVWPTSVQLTGFWSLLWIPEDSGPETDITSFCDIYPYGETISISARLHSVDKAISCFINDTPNDYAEIKAKDLWIMKPDLERLYEAIVSKMPLKNIFNNTNLAEMKSSREKLAVQNQNEPRPRVTTTQIDMVIGLMALHPEIGRELLYNPYKLFDLLEEMFARNGMRCPVNTGDTIKTWIERQTIISLVDKLISDRDKP
ncbi:hypothetical protein [Tolumonas osonensis]|uniref:Uncharacterized protein n=1 Tax=Tolumonas osonensis TaxID=675874 RepID=A0A841GKS4_9GAMM|nr:hypothetical protein [Tolumonas osonensis]MBB6055102.1 hypothetical protein [Tolumonas osonensis]